MPGRIFDFLVELLKWPMAILAVVSLPARVNAFDYFSMANMRFFAFLCGAFTYLALKIVASARTNVSMQILAHEFTHIFFALITFHKVVHIHLNMDESGGAMGFKGKGNWLIVVAPYFFPLCFNYTIKEIFSQYITIFLLLYHLNLKNNHEIRQYLQHHILLL